jgi:hypothetical protein
MRNPVTSIQPELSNAHRVTSDDNIERRNNTTINNNPIMDLVSGFSGSASMFIFLFWL